MSDNSTLIDTAKAAAAIFTDARTDGMPTPYSVALYPDSRSLVLHFHTIAELERWATWRGITTITPSDVDPLPDSTYQVDVAINESGHKHATLRCRMHGVRVIGMASRRANDSEVAATAASRAVVPA